MGAPPKSRIESDGDNHRRQQHRRTQQLGRTKQRRPHRRQRRTTASATPTPAYTERRPTPMATPTTASAGSNSLIGPNTRPPRDQPRHLHARRTTSSAPTTAYIGPNSIGTGASHLVGPNSLVEDQDEPSMDRVTRRADARPTASATPDNGYTEPASHRTATPHPTASRRRTTSSTGYDRTRPKTLRPSRRSGRGASRARTAAPSDETGDARRRHQRRRSGQRDQSPVPDPEHRGYGEWHPDRPRRGVDRRSDSASIVPVRHRRSDRHRRIKATPSNRTVPLQIPTTWTSTRSPRTSPEQRHSSSSEAT